MVKIDDTNKILVLYSESEKKTSKNYFFLIFLIVIMDRYKTKNIRANAPIKNTHFMIKIYNFSNKLKDLII